MWHIKTWQFKTPKGQAGALARYRKWIETNGDKNEWHQIFVNNAFGVEYRKLRRVY